MREYKRIIFTPRMVKSFDRLLCDMRKYKLLSREEEHELWENMIMGSKSARDLLINSNLRFVLSEAKKYLWSGVAIEDLFQAGALGLTIAVDHFDATREVNLISYAVWQIRNEIQKAVNAHLRYGCDKGLEDSYGFGYENDRTYLDIMRIDHKWNADWDVRFETAMKDLKTRVKDEFFDEAADLFEDYLEMTEKGYTLSDVAKEHFVTEDRAKEMIVKIMRSLMEYYGIPNRPAA